MPTKQPLLRLIQALFEAEPSLAHIDDFADNQFQIIDFDIVSMFTRYHRDGTETSKPGGTRTRTRFRGLTAAENPVFWVATYPPDVVFGVSACSAGCQPALSAALRALAESC